MALKGVELVKPNSDLDLCHYLLKLLYYLKITPLFFCLMYLVF
jgi:hypothetical protein